MDSVIVAYSSGGFLLLSYCYSVVLYSTRNSWRYTSGLCACMFLSTVPAVHMLKSDVLGAISVFSLFLTLFMLPIFQEMIQSNFIRSNNIAVLVKYISGIMFAIDIILRHMKND